MSTEPFLSQPSPQPSNGAFLLRFWREYDGSPQRFLLKSVHTNEHMMFRDLDSLLTHLAAALEQQNCTDISPPVSYSSGL